jgi:hypothetical protein
MATTESKPAAQDRNLGLARSATRVDPQVPLPAVLGLVQAAALLGVGGPGYRLVHDDHWPTPVLRFGQLIKIHTQPLPDLLGGITHEVA